MNKYVFEDVASIILNICKEIGRIPTNAEIDNDKTIPHRKLVNKIFKERGYSGYIDYCEKKGYSTKRQSKFHKCTFDDLCEIWDEYFEKYGFYPNSETCNKQNKLPHWDRVKKICGERFGEFAEKYGLCKISKVRSYEEYCKRFIQISNEIGRPLKAEELQRKNKYSNILPSWKWFIRNCPDESVKSYNDFLRYLGFKPRYEISKEYAEQAIFKKYKELNRPLMYDDFRNPNGIDEIGITTIRNHWGTFNKMLKDLNLPVNQEDMVSKQRSIDELKEDVIKLCHHIKEKEGRTVIRTIEINECSWCLNRGVYQRYFKKYLGMTLSQFIRSIGFVPVESGRGMIHTFIDGEVTTSAHEYQVSTYLKSRNVSYERNKKYREFITGYDGYKDCDYVIKTNNGDTWYVEIAGVLDYNKMKKENDVRKKYRKSLNEKIEMLQEARVNYLVVYPHELTSKSLDEIFAFTL